MQDGKTGVLFPIDDLERAAQIIAPFLLEPERLRAMREAVLADSLRYALEPVAQKMIMAYRSL